MITVLDQEYLSEQNEKNIKKTENIKNSELHNNFTILDIENIDKDTLIANIKEKVRREIDN